MLPRYLVLFPYLGMAATSGDDVPRRVSLRLNDLEVQKLKVRDSIAKVKSSAPHMRERISELTEQLAALEKLSTVEEAKSVSRGPCVPNPSTDPQRRRLDRVSTWRLLESRLAVQGAPETTKSLGDTLRKAAAAGDLETVTRLCADKKRIGTFVNTGNFEGTTALIKAAIFDQADVFEVLVAAGANPAMMDERGRSALMLAAANNSQAVLQRLIALEVALDVVATSNGWNAFMFAVQGGHLAAAQMLFDACGTACMDQRSLDGKNAQLLLAECADLGRAQAMQQWLKHVAQERGEDTTSWAPLRQLQIASAAAAAFEEQARGRAAGNGAQDKGTRATRSGLSFATVLLSASAALHPTSLLNALRHSTWTRARSSSRAQRGVRV